MSLDNLTFLNESIISHAGGESGFTLTRAVNHYLTAVYGFLSSFGIVSNSMVIYIFMRYKDMHTPINYSFCNLAMTDLFFMLVHGVPTVFKRAGFVLGKELCKVLYYMRSVSAQETGIMLAYISYDRYKTISDPFKALKDKKGWKYMSGLSLITWIISFILHTAVPILGNVDRRGSCVISFIGYDYLREPHFIYSTVVIYILPVSAIVFFYTRLLTHPHIAGPQPGANRPGGKGDERKSRTTRLVTITILFYAVCWLPRHACILAMVYSFEMGNFAVVQLMYKMSLYTSTLAYVNSALNPFLYAFAGTGFAKHIPSISCPCGVSPRTSQEKHDTSHVVFNSSNTERALSRTPQLDKI